MISFLTGREKSFPAAKKKTARPEAQRILNGLRRPARRLFRVGKSFNEFCPSLLNVRCSYGLGSYALAVLLILLGSMGCGLSSAGGPRSTPPPTSSGKVPQFGHVVLVVEENSSYSEVIGNSDMPYLNNLARQYGLATQYFANTHPSIGNYFMLTTGQIITNDDSFTGTVDVDNIVRKLLASGKTGNLMRRVDTIRFSMPSGTILFRTFPMW